VVAIGCLVAGFLAGDRADLFYDGPQMTDASAEPSTPRPPVAVGMISKSYEATDSSTGFDFELPVLNSSMEDIWVRGVAVVGLAAPVTTDYGPKVSPGAWEVLEFEAPADCSRPLPIEVFEVGLRVETPSGIDDVEVRLPYGGAAALLEYQRAVCTRAAPLDRGDLTGVWALQTVYGPETYMEGELLMRFNRDGSYAVDWEDGLFSRDVDVWGTYRIMGRLLTLMPRGGAVCGFGDNSMWRPAVDAEEGLLTMVWLGGGCPDGEGSVWIARRVLLASGLPEKPSGTGQTHR
jgi:hypothetical protein